MKEPARYIYPLFLACLLVWFLSHVQHILLPFVLAATLAYLVNPIVGALESRGMKHGLAVIAVFAGLIFAGVSGAYLGVKALVQKSPEVGEELPAHLVKVEDVVNEGLRWIQDWEPGQALGLSDWLENNHELVLLDFPKIFGDPMRHIAPIVESVFLIPFLAYFFLLEGPGWWDEVLRLAPAGRVEMLLYSLMEVEYSFGNYLRGLFLQALFMGGVAGLGFWLMGLHYAGRIAAWVALTSMIPFVGPTSAAVAGGAVALFQWGTMAGILKVLGVYLAIRLLDDWFFHPFVMRQAVHLHPIVTVFALLCGASLYGFWGLLFAIPVVCVVKVLIAVTWHYYRAAYGMDFKTSPFKTEIPVI